METVAEVSAEERIKKAAKLIFTRKGFLATTVRDIATEADINVASVNYYFRSKENLFRLIMAETIDKTFAEIEPVFYNTSLSLIQKIELMADHFIEKALNDPDLPLFLVREVMAGSNSLPLIRNLPAIMESDFANQVRALSTDGKIQHNPFHIILNMGSMMIFPFLSLAQVTNFGDATKGEFFELMKERKKLIPMWIGQMIGA
ncbi:TetR/AcrR family transcriptional regulator [Mucilaginibacter flavus]|uniref:TetR/AcrR family transcriptional regulator n=1 Tax=Mucilaginibacter flavus TaxID=931504 RepID=UPI0025B37C6F|nr:TetR family transcriptional regulator [Mucilaginibacter flavus]MDN3584287.1 TetR family transcriptional regulator [Mucilaginibacter flavus]